MPAATQSLLDDAVVDLDQWIAAEVEAAFAEQEGAAFVTGNGTNKPKGFLGLHPGRRGELGLGQDRLRRHRRRRRLAGQQRSDVLIDTVYALKAGYRQNASWVMNRKTQAAIRKLKDAEGNYLWQPPATPGSSAMLMGFPLVEAEDMPDIGSDATPIAFGDFRAAIWWSTAPACACCATPIRPSPTCCSTRPSASAAACRISTRSSC